MVLLQVIQGICVRPTLTTANSNLVAMVGHALTKSADTNVSVLFHILVGTAPRNSILVFLTGARMMQNVPLPWISWTFPAPVSLAIQVSSHSCSVQLLSQIDCQLISYV